MSKTKICFVTREYAHFKTGVKGGIGVFTKQHAKQLSVNEFNIKVFTFGESKLKFKDGLVEVLQIKDLNKLNNQIKNKYLNLKLPGYISLKIALAFVNRLYRSICFSYYAYINKFDIVEFHDYGGDVPFYFGNAVKVLRCHGSARTLHRSMGYVYRKVDDIFEGLAVKNYKKNIVAVSNYAATITKSAFSLTKKPKVIYNGVSNTNTLLSQNPSINKNIIPNSIFYFGSVRERKGIEVACRVFNKVNKIYPSSTFHIIGHNNNKQWEYVGNTVLTKEALSKTVYYGVVPNSDTVSYLEKAQIVLFPSYGENFSIALLEVMALGKLVITSNIPAFKEIIDSGNNGFMVNIESDYVNNICAIFEQTVDLDFIASNAKVTIESNFDLKEIINENIEYYKSLI